MGEIIKFERGCRNCKNLVQTDKNTYMCMDREHIDGSDVYPIVYGRHTNDWNVCHGESYVRVFNSHSKTI